jgi:hypothetical protein
MKTMFSKHSIFFRIPNKRACLLGFYVKIAKNFQQPKKYVDQKTFQDSFKSLK